MTRAAPASADRPRVVDTRIEERLGLLLRLGVVVSTVCLAAGLLLYLYLGDGWFANSLLTTGLILLLATPVARVAMSVVEYARVRDWRFVVLTAIVLLELCAGIIAALVFHRRL